MKSAKQNILSKKKNFILRYGIVTGILLFFIDTFSILFLGNYIDLSIFNNFMNMLISFNVVIMSFFCYKFIFKKSSKEKNFFLFLTVALGFKFLGEILWTYYDLSFPLMPAFSFADLAWFLSNLIIIAGFEYKLNHISFKHKKITVTIFIGVLVLLSSCFIYGVYLKLLSLETGAWFSYLVNESYVLFDLFILAVLMVPLYTSVASSEKSFRFYLFMALGFLSFIVYDFFFAEMYLKGIYSSAGKIEILYFFSYLLLYFAFYLELKLAKRK
jgi:hypothetical protein